MARQQSEAAKGEARRRKLAAELLAVATLHEPDGTGETWAKPHTVGWSEQERADKTLALEPEDSTITGITLIPPQGGAVYISAATAKRRKDGKADG